MDAFPAVGTPIGYQANILPGGEPPKRAHLYVGNLNSRVTEYMLQEIFATTGPVMGVKIIPDRTFQHGGVNYGFVEYHDMKSAETALQTLNGRKIFDMEIKCNWAYQNTGPKEDLTNHCHIFVGDLSPEVTDEVLQKAFIAFGSLSDARVMWDMNTGKSRGYGFLAFRDRTDAEQAIASMNGEWLGSRAIRVNYANQKTGQDGPGGGGGPGGGMRQGGNMGGIGAPPSNRPPGGPGGPPGGPGMGMPFQGPSQPQQASAPLPPPVMNSYGGPPPSYDVVVSQAPPSNTTVYVGNLVPYTQQADLIPLFQGFGYIQEVRMQADRGFAFMRMDTHENAAMAIVNVQGRQLHGRPLKTSWGKDKGGDTATGAAASAPPPVQSQAPMLQGQQLQNFAQQYAGYGAQAPQDPAAMAAAAAAWQAQYGAQYAAYFNQQVQMAQQQQGIRQ